MNYLVHHLEVLKYYLLFVLAYDAKDDENTGIKNNQNNFLPKAENENYNVLIDKRNFYDLPINDLIKHYDDIVI